MSNARIDRRGFMLLCGSACIPMLGACAHVQYLNATTSNGRLTVAKASLSTVPFAFVRLETTAFPIYVSRNTTTNVYAAVLTRCMHRGCQVEPENGHLVCPCHGSEYTNTGEILQGPTALPLIRFAVESDAESIYIMTAGVEIP
jgi:cytochrome b6-f complex iron-sulfur subunit